MPEGQNVEGDRWLDKAIEILKALGWKQRGDKKVDISSPNSGTSYGIDAYFTYNDPYENTTIGIIMEAKSRQWKSVNSNFLEREIKRLSEAIQAINLNGDEFNQKLNFNEASKVNSAILMLWVNDHNYNREKFIEYLESVEIPKKWKLQRIFIASNSEILRFCTIIETYRELMSESQGTFRYYYPSLTLTKYEPKRLNYLTLEYLFSKYIFGKMTVQTTTGKTQIPMNITVVLYFDEISLNALKLMYNALIRFQLLDEVDEVRIYFNKPLHHYRSVLEEFKRRIPPKNNIVFKFEQMKIAPSDVYQWRRSE